MIWPPCARRMGGDVDVARSDLDSVRTSVPVG